MFGFIRLWGWAALALLIAVPGTVHAAFPGPSASPKNAKNHKLLVVELSHRIWQSVIPPDFWCKNLHHPIVITKEVDRSSPLLLNALVTNENIRLAPNEAPMPRDRCYFTYQVPLNVLRVDVHLQPQNFKLEHASTHTFEYDGVGRTTSITDPSGGRTTSQYDTSAKTVTLKLGTDDKLVPSPTGLIQVSSEDEQVKLEKTGTTAAQLIITVKLTDGRPLLL